MADNFRCVEYGPFSGAMINVAFNMRQEPSQDKHRQRQTIPRWLLRPAAYRLPSFHSGAAAAGGFGQSGASAAV
jgi:hypothetical protein